jgi:hypothetical protein
MRPSRSIRDKVAAMVGCSTAAISVSTFCDRASPAAKARSTGACPLKTPSLAERPLSEGEIEGLKVMLVKTFGHPFPTISETAAIEW